MNIEIKGTVVAAAIVNNFFHLDSTMIMKSKESQMDLMLIQPIVLISLQSIHLQRRSTLLIFIINNMCKNRILFKIRITNKIIFLMLSHLRSRNLICIKVKINKIKIQISITNQIQKINRIFSDYTFWRFKRGFRIFFLPVVLW